LIFVEIDLYERVLKRFVFSPYMGSMHQRWSRINVTSGQGCGSG